MDFKQPARQPRPQTQTQSNPQSLQPDPAGPPPYKPPQGPYRPAQMGQKPTQPTPVTVKPTTPARPSTPARLAPPTRSATARPAPAAPARGNRPGYQRSMDSTARRRVPPTQQTQADTLAEDNEPEVTTTPPPKKRSKLIWIIPLAIFALIALGSGAFMAWRLLSDSGDQKQNTATKAEDKQQAETSPTETESQTSTPATSAEPKTFISDTYNLELTHPGNWTAEEGDSTEANTPGKVITITSKPAQVPTADGKTTPVIAQVLIRPKGARIAHATNGSSYKTVVASTSLDYAKPSEIQRAETNLSPIHDTAITTAADGYEQVLVTGSKAYAKDADVKLADLAAMEPFVSIAFYACPTEPCTADSDSLISLATSTWQTKPQLILDITSLVASFVFVNR